MSSDKICIFIPRYPSYSSLILIFPEGMRMESTLRSQRKSHETSHRVSTSTCKHSFEPESLSRLVHSTTAASAYDKVRDFIEAVGPFHRAVYLIALAYENDAAGAELIAVQAMATAFRTWQGQQMGNELKMFLIGITIAEAQSYLHRNRAAVIRDCREDIGNVFCLPERPGMAAHSSACPARSRRIRCSDWSNARVLD